MKLDTSKAIIIGSIIIAVGFFFNSAYERQLSYNMCVKMMIENPRDSLVFSNKNWIEKACEWSVYVRKGNWDYIFPNIKKK